MGLGQLRANTCSSGHLFPKTYFEIKIEIIQRHSLLTMILNEQENKISRREQTFKGVGVGVDMGGWI